MMTRANRFNRPWVKATLAAVCLVVGYGVARKSVALRQRTLPPAAPRAAGQSNSPAAAVPMDFPWLCGGNQPDPIRGNRLQPYTWFQQRFDHNVRDYFHTGTSPATQLLRDWNVPGSDDRFLEVVEPEAGQSLRLRLEARTTALPRWPVLDLRRTVNLRPGQRATTRIRLRARPPREIIVAHRFAEPDGNRFEDATVVAGEAWADLELSCSSVSQDVETSISLCTAPGAGEIEIASLAVQPPPQPPDRPENPYFVDFRANRYGFRERDVPRETPPNTLRIACLGDSFTFGIGVHEQDAYPRVLEALCNRDRQPGVAAVQVLNFGMPSYALDAELDVYVQEAAAFNPRIVFVQLCYNDAPTTAQETAFNNEPGQAGLDRYVAALSGFIKTHGYAQAIECLGRLHRACQDHDARLVVGIFNALPGWEWEQMVREVLPAMQAAGIPAFDVAGPITAAGLMGNPGIAHPADHHPNEHSHRVFAAELKRTLDERGLLP